MKQFKSSKPIINQLVATTLISSFLLTTTAWAKPNRVTLKSEEEIKAEVVMKARAKEVEFYPTARCLLNKMNEDDSKICQEMYESASNIEQIDNNLYIKLKKDSLDTEVMMRVKTDYNLHKHVILTVNNITDSKGEPTDKITVTFINTRGNSTRSNSQAVAVLDKGSRYVTLNITRKIDTANLDNDNFPEMYNINLIARSSNKRHWKKIPVPLYLNSIKAIVSMHSTDKNRHDIIIYAWDYDFRTIFTSKTAKTVGTVATFLGMYRYIRAGIAGITRGIMC